MIHMHQVAPLAQNRGVLRCLREPQGRLLDCGGELLRAPPLMLLLHSSRVSRCTEILIDISLSFGLLIDQILIILTMSVTLWLAGEELIDKDNVDASGGGACSAFVDLFKSLKNLPPAMFSVLAVTAVTWVRTRAAPHTTDSI